MSRPTLRIVVGVLGGLFAAAAVLLAALRCFPAATMLAVWAAICLIGLAVERWRYKPLGERPPGPAWQATGERFIDPETGKLVDVYFDPHTGERRYVAA